MNAFLGNELVQKQQMALTPKMAEELKILQMSNIDLVQYLEVLLTENPLFDIEASEQADAEELSDMDTWEESGYGYIQKESQLSDFAEYVSTPQSLRQYLLSQLGEIKIPVFYRRIAAYLIDNINEDGYLMADIRQIAVELNISLILVKAVLKVIQGFEPSGVGARSLKESLLIQLNKKGIKNNDIKVLIMNFLELLAARKYTEISQKTGLTKQQAVEAHIMIKSLNPKPGRSFENSKGNVYVIPELETREIDGEYIVLFSAGSELNLRIYDYHKRLKSDDKYSKEIRKYIRSNLSKAMEIINAVEQRKRTVLNVAGCIVQAQTEFLKKGHKYLKPLTMKAVADVIGIHESTVSRAVKNKYIQTPRGTFELKFFFSSQADYKSSEDISSRGVKNIIFQIIKSEDKSRPLSDEQIRKELEMRGVNIARRTVAKYRESLDILPILQRSR